MPATPSRRRLLQRLTIGGSLLLAGCGQSDSTPSTDNPGASGQTFRAPTGNDPAKTSFYIGGKKIQNTAYAPVVKEPASWKLRRFLMEPGVWISGSFAPSPATQIHYNWIEKPMEISPTEVTISIRDDARWSDGHPVTGKDLAYLPLRRTLARGGILPLYASESEGEPHRVEYAFDKFQVRYKSVTYRSSPGYFEDFWDIAIAFWLGTHFFPTFSPTHIEPFESYADGIIEMARRAKAGEIHPWYIKSDGKPDPGGESLVEEHLTKTKYVHKFAKPENVLSTGPWHLTEMRGPEFIFEPNSHHRYADELNFESFTFAHTESADRQRAALNAGRLDYGSSGVTPKSVVDAFPDNFKEVLIPGGGNQLQMNFNHPALATREVRQAIMYALDHEAIAKNIHESIAEPVNTPGGDAWKATEYVSQDWIDENLITYPQNRERAAQLMRAAGYSKSGGQWVGVSGEPFTLTLPARSSPPRWEPTVAHQLSEFGIDTTVSTLDGTAFENRRKKGEFNIWPSGGGLTGNASGILNIWFLGATKDPYMIYPNEQYKSGEFTGNGVPKPRSKERYSVFTINAPPVGEPDSPLQEYPTGVWGLSHSTNPSQAEFQRRVKLSMWLANWFLPTIPINKQHSQRFIDAANWDWPTDSASWESFVSGDLRPMEEVLRNWQLKANPANPKEGTTVGEN